MINHRNKQNYRFRTWKFRDRCHLKGGVRQGCFLSLILNNLIKYIHFHSLYITSHYYAKFKENPCVGTDARPPLRWKSKSVINVPLSLSFFIFVLYHIKEVTSNAQSQTVLHLWCSFSANCQTKLYPQRCYCLVWNRYRSNRTCAFSDQCNFPYSLI